MDVLGTGGCLTLLLCDGMSQLFLDFSLHGEEVRLNIENC